jgi:hypothetical protein
MYPRRLPGPWKIVERRDAYVVTDGLGQHIAYLYFDDERAGRQNLKGLSKWDAERIARAIIRVPALLQREDT